jgi:hypothetical protein
MSRFLAFLLVVLGACGGQTSGSTSTTGSPVASSCAWPANLASQADAGSWAPSVGRYFLSCKDGAAFELCVSDDPTTCPGPNAIADGTLSDCVDKCNANEFVVAAGGPPQLQPDGGFLLPPSPDLPSGCRSVGNNPAGVTYSCCPCA